MLLKIDTVRLHLKNAWKISRGTSSFKDNVFIAIDKDGLCGLGEAAPNIRYNENPAKTIAALENINLESCLFENFWDTKRELERVIKNQNCALAAIDMAILDWIGKKNDIPLYKMFGLNPQKAPVTSFSIGIDSLENVQRIVEQNKLMPVFKIKMGIKGDRKAIEAIREVTDKPLRVDANEGWKTKEYALEQIKWLADRNIEFIEQPMPAAQLSDYSWLKEKSPLPLIADESVSRTEDILKISPCFDGINIKLMKAGGILEAMRMIHLAKALNLKIMLGCMIESSLAISAAAQLSPFADYADLDGNLLIVNDPYKGVRIKNGWLILNNKPGLGVEKVTN